MLDLQFFLLLPQDSVTFQYSFNIFENFHEYHLGNTKWLGSSRSSNKLFLEYNTALLVLLEMANKDNFKLFSESNKILYRFFMHEGIIQSIIKISILKKRWD